MLSLQFQRDRLEELLSSESPKWIQKRLMNSVAVMDSLRIEKTKSGVRASFLYNDKEIVYAEYPLKNGETLTLKDVWIELEVKFCNP